MTQWIFHIRHYIKHKKYSRCTITVDNKTNTCKYSVKYTTQLNTSKIRYQLKMCALQISIKGNANWGLRILTVYNNWNGRILTSRRELKSTVVSTPTYVVIELAIISQLSFKILSCSGSISEIEINFLFVCHKYMN